MRLISRRALMIPAGSLFVLLFLGGLLVLVRQRAEISTLRRENQQWRDDYQTVQKASDEHRELNPVRNENLEIEQAQKDHADLLRLRNEVGLLREQQRELEKLRIENIQLRVLNDRIFATGTNGLADSNQASGSEPVGERRRAWLGIDIGPLGNAENENVAPQVQAGVLIAGVSENSPAERADLQPRDIITEVDGRAVATVQDFISEMLTKSIGQFVVLAVTRQGANLKVKLKTAEWPEHK